MNGHVADALVRMEFRAFVIKFWPEINPGKEFLWNWHHKAIAHELSKCGNAFADNRLIVNLPPQHGKSELISVLYTAWTLGRDPTRKILCVSYGETLATRFGAQTLQIMQSSEYRRIFPATQLSKQTTGEISTTKGGRRYATTVHGQITGHPADVIIIDDPHKIDSSLTNAEIEKTNSWADETLASRLSKPSKGVIICVMQRVRRNDLTGHYLSKVGEPWRQLKLPLVAETDNSIEVGNGEQYTRKEGEILHAEWRTENDVKLAKHNPRVFASQHQQNPMPDGGVILKPEYLAEFQVGLSIDDYESIFIGVDGASSLAEDASYSAVVAVGIRNNQFDVLAAWRGRVEIAQLKGVVEKFIDQTGASHVVIEKAASGIALFQMLRPEFDNYGIYEFPPKGSKEERLNSVLSLFVQKRVLFSPPGRRSSFTNDLVAELLTVPNGKTDDLADALVLVLQAVFLYGAHLRARIDYSMRKPSLKFWRRRRNRAA